MQLVWFNQVISTLWPHIGKVMYKQVLAQAGPALKDVCKMVGLSPKRSQPLIPYFNYSQTSVQA